jgi:hypothetical protein
VAITEAKKKDLADKKLDALYTSHQNQWDDMYATAEAYARKNISDGKDPHPDDIVVFLLPTLEVNETLREHREEYKCKAVRFGRWFAEYVIYLNAPGATKP